MIGENLVKLKNERLKTQEDEDDGGNSNRTDEQPVKTEFDRKTDSRNYEQQRIFSKPHTNTKKQRTELNFTMNCGS